LIFWKEKKKQQLKKFLLFAMVQVAKIEKIMKAQIFSDFLRNPLARVDGRLEFNGVHFCYLIEM